MVPKLKSKAEEKKFVAKVTKNWVETTLKPNFLIYYLTIETNLHRNLVRKKVVQVEIVSFEQTICLQR